MSKIKTMLAFVALLLCGGAWAATPVAVWDGDFTSLTKNKVTLANVGASANPVVGENGSAYIQIADTATKGVFVNWDNLYNVADIGFSGKEVTVIVAYSDMPTPATNAKGALFTLTSQATTTSDNNSDWLGVMANSSGQTSAMVGSNSTWTHNSENPKGTFDFSADGQNLRYYAFSYKSSGASSLPTGTQLFQKGTDGTWTQVYGSWGLKGSSADIRGCCIGGPRYVTYAGALQGLKIHKIAVFNSIVGKDDIAAYTFPSDLKNGYQKWAQNPAVLTWTGTTGLLHNGPFALFDCAAGADTATSFTGTATNVKTIPGRYNDNTTPWNVFSSAIDVSPGYVLRFAGTTATKQIDAQWGELNFGGMIVEAGAEGYSFYTKVNNNTRNTTFGDSQKKRDTWYVFNESFTIHRETTTANLTLRGPVNIEVANQKVFTVEYSNPTLQDGATLRMHGLGKMVCPKLVATGNVALDFRDEMFKTRDTAFINGQLQIDGTTKIHFPAGWEAGEAHKLTLCTGDLTGAPSEKSANTVFIGDTETDVYLHYDTANKSVYYTSATLITNYTFTEADKTAISEFELAQGQIYEYNPNVGEFAEGCVFSGIDGIYAWADAFSTIIKVTKATDSFSLKTGTRTSNKDSAIRDSDASVGGFAVHGKLWNNTPVHNENNSEQTGSMTLMSGTGSTADGVKVYFRAPNTYFNSSCGVDAGNKRLTASYFDDGATAANTQWTVGDVTLPQAPCARGWQLRLTNIPYEMYDLYIYFASDQAATDLQATAMALSVDGGTNWKWYAGDPAHNATIAAAQSNTWKADPYSNGTLTEGTNYIKIRVSAAAFGNGSLSTLDITHGPRNTNSKIRSGLAGIQIVKVEDDGVYIRAADTTDADWTAANMWKRSNGTTTPWPTSAEMVLAQVDADQTSSITVDGVINANMVTVSNTAAGQGEEAKSFKFLTKEPLDQVATEKDPEEYVLKSPVDATDFHGNLYLQSRIRGRVTLGNDTSLTFVAGEAGQDTEENRAIVTTAFPYEFAGSNNPIKKVGYGTFVVPSSMYDRAFSFNEGAIRYDVAGSVSGSLTGSGKVVKSGTGTLVFSGNDLTTGGLEVQQGTVQLNKSGDFGFWNAETARPVSVANGAVLDINGCRGFKANVTLANGGVLASDDANRDLGDAASLYGIALEGDATVRVVGDFGLLANGYGATSLVLDNHTLTKSGDGVFFLCNTSSETTGTIDVTAGTFKTVTSAVSLPNVTVKMQNGTTLDVTQATTLGTLQVLGAVTMTGSGKLTANLMFASGASITSTTELDTTGMTIDTGYSLHKEEVTEDETTSYVYTIVRKPTTVYAVSFAFNQFKLEDGTIVDLVDGDEIVIPADITGGAWSCDVTPLLGHKVIVKQSMNWKKDISAMSIDANVVVYLYDGNIAANANIEGAGKLKIMTDVTVGADATIATALVIGQGQGYANPGTLTVPTALPAGTVKTDVTGKIIKATVNNNGTVTYSVVAPEASITIDGVTTPYVTLAEAISDAAEDGLTVVVERDVTLDAELTVPVGVTLDIGSATITGQINVRGAIAGIGTIQNLVMYNEAMVIIPNEDGILTAYQGKFEGKVNIANAARYQKPLAYLAVANIFSDETTRYVPTTLSFVDGDSVTIGVAFDQYDSDHQVTLLGANTAVAKIGEKGYATLEAALSAAQEDETVALLAANSETVIIPENVTVDVNGQTFTGVVSGEGSLKVASFAAIKSATNLKNSLQNGAWTGTLVIDGNSNLSSINDGTVGAAGNGYRTLLNDYGNIGSKIELLNCTYDGNGNGNNYFGLTLDNNDGTVNLDTVVQPELIITGELKLRNGFSQSDNSGNAAYKYRTEFHKLSGTGTILAPRSDLAPLIYFHDASEFRGSFNSSGYKFVIGERAADADAYPAIGSVTIKSDKEMTLAKDANWTLSNGVTVDGTLTFEAPDAATTKVYSLALKGAGTLVTKAVSESTQMKYILNNHANFRGSITTEVGAHVMLAPVNTTTTSLGFSNCGFISIQSGSATIGDGETWTGGVKNGNGGAYLAANTTLNVGGAASIVGKLFALNSTIAFANWNSSLTIDGNFQAEGAGTRIAITLPNEALDEEKTLISWTGKVNVSGETFTCANLPAGYDLSVEDTCLKLVQVQDLVTERTTDVSNSVSMNSLWIGASGVQKFTGTGGVQASDLQMRDGSVLVIDPVKNPLYITRATPTFAAGAKIKLDAAYAGKKGAAMLMTWEGDVEPTLPEDLFDTETYPNSVLSFKHYTSDLQSNDSSGNVITTVSKTMTALMVDLDTTVPKKPLKIMPLGDSITEGTNQVGFGNPNYRMFLLARLAIEGYDVSSTGFRRVKTMNAAGAAMPNEWCWHNGVSGQRLCSSGSRAGWRDALEPTLDASEIPDVITFKIGTNDQGTNVEQLYAEWVAVMNRIIAARPSTKIIVGSIMDIVRNDNWENDWNSKLKDAIEQNTPGFPANQVFFADLNKANPRNGEGGAYLGTFYSSTDLHPNWIGHEKNAQCWADAIVAALADDKSLAAKYEPNLKMGALANVAPEYLKGFVKLATFKPNNAAIAKNTTPTYAAKANIDSNAKITKVGYYMELKNSRSGNVRWVWADMDNWNAEEENKVFSKIEIPSAYTYQGEANNLHVDTNDGGIEKIAPTVEGKKAWLQFCRGGAGNGGNVSGAPGNFFGWDWNDQMNDGGSYGIMQLYRVAPTVVEGGVTGDNSRAAQVLMAFNRFTSANGQEIGIGNCAIHGAPKTAANVTTTVNYMMTTDYDRLNLASYDLATIEIWGVVDGTQYVMPDAPALEVEASTADEATAACTVVTDAAADSEAGQGGQAQFLTLQATRVGSSNNWKVRAVVDNAKLPEDKKIDDTAVAFANAGGIVKLAGATEKQTISIPKDKATPGLYYSVLFGTTPDNHTQESERVLATSDDGTVDIPVPPFGNEKVYYIKIKASATK